MASLGNLNEYHPHRRDESWRHNQQRKRRGIGALLRALWRRRFGLVLSLAILVGALAWAVNGTGWVR